MERVYIVLWSQMKQQNYDLYVFGICLLFSNKRYISIQAMNRKHIQTKYKISRQIIFFRVGWDLNSKYVEAKACLNSLSIYFCAHEQQRTNHYLLLDSLQLFWSDQASMHRMAPTVSCTYANQNSVQFLAQFLGLCGERQLCWFHTGATAVLLLLKCFY